VSGILFLTFEASTYCIEVLSYTHNSDFLKVRVTLSYHPGI